MHGRWVGGIWRHAQLFWPRRQRSACSELMLCRLHRIWRRQQFWAIARCGWMRARDQMPASGETRQNAAEYAAEWTVCCTVQHAELTLQTSLSQRRHHGVRGPSVPFCNVHQMLLHLLPAQHPKLAVALRHRQPHLDVCRLEVLAQHVLQRGNRQLHRLLRGELGVVFELFLQEIDRLLLLGTRSRRLLCRQEL